MVREKHTAVAIFPGHDAVVGAVRRLHELGFGHDRVSVLAKDEAALNRTLDEVDAIDGRVVDKPSLIVDDAEPKGEDEAAGMLIGGGVGLVIGLSAIALPGLGAFLLAAGPVAVALHGLTFAAGGLGMGALIGAIIDERATEEHRERYEHALERGEWLVVVHGEDAEIERAASAMRDTGGRVDAY